MCLAPRTVGTLSISIRNFVANCPAECIAGMPHPLILGGNPELKLIRLCVWCCTACNVSTRMGFCSPHGWLSSSQTQKFTDAQTIEGRPDHPHSPGLQTQALTPTSLSLTVAHVTKSNCARLDKSLSLVFWCLDEATTMGEANQNSNYKQRTPGFWHCCNREF